MAVGGNNVIIWSDKTEELMIKGVNKQIIEVNETENEFFDKAILFVRSEKYSVSTNRLRSEASSLLSGYSLSGQAKKLVRNRIIIFASACAVLSSGATIVILAMLGGLSFL
ncbi:MAG: hypothetical protein IKS19_06890 [Clostridia bacterium]|nr:hypothetical protein [Clostridia bacterium]